MVTRTVPAAVHAVGAADQAPYQTPHPARPAGTHPLWPALAVLAVPVAMVAMVAMVAAGLVRPSPSPAARQVPEAHAAADAPAGPPAGPRSRPAAEPPPPTNAVSLAAAHLQAARAAGVDPDALAAYVAGRRGVLLDAVPIVVEAAGGGGGGGGGGGAGRQQLVLTGSGAGCASCHATWIAVWDARARAVVWEAADGRDTTVRPLPGGAGFARADSVRLEGEPSCCPSRREERALVWDGTTFTDAAAGAGADAAAAAEAGAPPSPSSPPARGALRRRPVELASAVRRG